MEFRASHRFARISARKARLVMDQVRGRGINEALDILQFSNKRASVMIDKVVRSAMANASMDSEVNVNRLFLSDARVDEGPLAQGRVRYRFRSRGGVVPIRKRTCHISVRLAPRPEPTGGAAKGGRNQGSKAKGGPTKAKAEA